jgi:hypothetical protein
MARRLAQVARLGRLAWWTLSLPSLLSLGRLGREVAYISNLSKQSPHVRCWQPISDIFGITLRAMISAFSGRINDAWQSFINSLKLVCAGRPLRGVQLWRAT